MQYRRYRPCWTGVAALWPRCGSDAAYAGGMTTPAARRRPAVRPAPRASPRPLATRRGRRSALRSFKLSTALASARRHGAKWPSGPAPVGIRTRGHRPSAALCPRSDQRGDRPARHEASLPSPSRFRSVVLFPSLINSRRWRASPPRRRSIFPPKQLESNAEPLFPVKRGRGPRAPRWWRQCGRVSPRRSVPLRTPRRRPRSPRSPNNTSTSFRKRIKLVPRRLGSGIRIGASRASRAGERER